MSNKNKPKPNLKQYAVYDENDTCCFIGSVKEISDYLKIGQKKIRNRMYRNIRVNRKYLIIKLED